MSDDRGVEVVHFECNMWQRFDEGMQRGIGLEAHPLYSAGACREAGDVQAELLEVRLVGSRLARGNAEVVVPPAAPGDDIGRLVALAAAGGNLRAVGG